ncbi:peptidoglycan D,D-transpeptidase FtsI family protein [Rhizobium sp. Root491]|uniref:peptidoglycan D,D-transpeptidase FtsI family protein n=1 Tax=Rhizobium sp. Root491 TaxID=1736548 RepID=UPI0012E3913C|nr:penicillin-binding protein 2 [Rhizobium sp. Root491]
MATFVSIFILILARLTFFGLLDPPSRTIMPRITANSRPAILDRNGAILAMDLPFKSAFAVPRLIVDIDEAVERITAVFPALDRRQLYDKLAARTHFAWIKRQITPLEEQALWDAGVPAVSFRSETKRFYPNGALASHVLGAVNVDNIGISGLEKWMETDGLADLRASGMDTSADALEPVVTTIDIRVQHALEDELRKAIKKYSAKAAAGLVLQVDTGEVFALASLPDFDPNTPSDALKPDRINRIAAANFEMGSTFKALTTAMAIDSGRYSIHSVIDASKPLAFGRARIHDFQGKYRPLSLPEAFIYSSNISMAKMALDIGRQTHRRFLQQFGQLDALRTELPESAMPLLPKRWNDIETATASFGHGLAVTPLQASVGVAALVNGGKLIRPTFIKASELAPRFLGTDLVKAETTQVMRYLFQLNAEVGSAQNGRVSGYLIGGKTGTAEKVVDGRYSKTLNITSFMGVVPADAPKFLVLTLLDEPRGLLETHGFRTSGWNAVPTGSAVFSRILPMLGELPSFDAPLLQSY